MIEKYWKTEAGLVAIAYLVYRDNRKSYRCGYVGINKYHPLYGVYYNDQIDCIPQNLADSAEIGKKSPIVLLTACVNSDGENKIRRSPDIIFDVHGGITYSGNGKNGYPINSKLYWYGFDCHHAGDGMIEPMKDGYLFHDGPARSLEYVTNECESLARQLVEFEKLVKLNNTVEA